MMDQQFQKNVIGYREWLPGPNAKSISVLGKSNYKSHFITDSEPWSCHFLNLAV